MGELARRRAKAFITCPLIAEVCLKTIKINIYNNTLTLRNSSIIMNERQGWIVLCETLPGRSGFKPG